MKTEAGSRLRPIPPAVLNGMSGRLATPRIGSAEVRERGERDLVPILEATALRELACWLDAGEKEPGCALDVIEGEVRALFGAHPESLRALQCAFSRLREAEEPSEERHAALGAFEELLEALVARHDLWGVGR